MLSLKNRVQFYVGCVNTVRFADCFVPRKRLALRWAYGTTQPTSHSHAKSTKLLSLIGILLCLFVFSSICDAGIDVSFVIPDNGPFNSDRLDAEDVKALGSQKTPRRISIYGAGFIRYMDVEFVLGRISKPVAEFRYISPAEIQVIPPDWEIPVEKTPVTVDIEVTSQADVGDRDVLLEGFTYNVPPEVESVYPNIGPQDPSMLPEGKEIIELKGVGFVKEDPTRPERTIQVAIGTKRFTPPAVLYESDRRISLAFSEPLYNSEGDVDIIVINPDGQTSVVSKRQYKIIGAPTIQKIRPGRGPIEGKNVVDIEGAGFEGSSFSVRANGQDARASSPTDELVVCSMPEGIFSTGVEKIADVQVIKHTVNQRGRSFDQISNPLKYTYLDMRVYRVEPDIGGKGMTATITGEDFFTSDDSEEERSTVEVFFGGEIPEGEPEGGVIGGTRGVNLNIIDSTKLTVEVPKGVGIVPVYVQQSWEAGEEYRTTDPFIRQVMSTENKFTYSTGPVIKNFTPKKGSVSGGTEVKIIGSNFYPDPDKIVVTFGDVQAKVEDVGREGLHVITPPHDAGIVVVTVQNPDGLSDSLDGFEYLEGPVIEAVKPNFGPLEGGNPTTISGKQLLEANEARFDNKKATLGARTDNELVVNAVPKKTAQAGLVDVVVAVKGQPDAVLPNSYTYREIEARNLVPDNGALKGGNTVTIHGSDFEGWDYDMQKAIAPIVEFVGVRVKVISYTLNEIEVLAPEGTGEVPVTITVRYLYTTPGETTPKEVKQTNADLTYSYNPLPVISSFRPLAGNKDDNLFIEGAGFLAGAEVKVGTTIVQPVSVTATQMRIILPEPKKDECEVGIIVANPDGQEASAPDQFEYLDCSTVTPPPDGECSYPPDGWSAKLTLTLDDNSATLTVGVDPEATDGFNPGLDFASPPLAPGAEFNAVFAGDFVDLVDDIRGLDQLENTWTVKLTSQSNVIFEADVSEIPECFVVQLGSIDLRKQSYGDLQPGDHILTVKPGDDSPPLDETITVTIPLERGWNLISFPGDLVDASPQSILGGSVISILDGNSVEPAALTLGEGYWVLAIAAAQIEVEVYPATEYTRSVKRGWNLIGGVIFDAPMPEGVIQLANWNAVTQVYESPITLLSTIGYWAFVLEDGEITVKVTPPQPPGAPGATALWELPLTLTNAEGHRTILEMGIAPQATSGYDQHLDRFLPPPPPDSQNAMTCFLSCNDTKNKNLIAGFPFEQDGNFSLQRSVLSMAGDGETRWSLRVSSPDSEATLYWDVAQIPEEWSLQLVDGNRQVDMSHASTYRIPQGMREIQFVLRRKPQEIKPAKSMLLQNYPNPFNPETWIPYQLADTAQVSLTIYDVHGRIVRKLSIGQKAAGVYVDRGKAVYWNGRNDHGERVSSGLYFYRLKAGNFSAVRRMVIAK